MAGRHGNQPQSSQCCECGHVESQHNGRTSSDGQFFCNYCWEAWENGHNSGPGSWWRHDQIKNSAQKANAESYNQQDRWYHQRDPRKHIAGCYCDAHCHLDYMLLNEKYGFMRWMHKTKLCYRWEDTRQCEYGYTCNFAHGSGEIVPRKPLEPRDLEGFAWQHRVSGCTQRRRSQDQISEHQDVPPPPPPSHGWRQSRRLALLGCLITNCCEMNAIDDTVMLVDAGKHLLDGRVYCTFGVHPGNYREYNDESEARLIEALEACGEKAVAWGECGLDYAKGLDSDDPRCREQMLRVFARQADIAVARCLPLVVHTRGADEDTLRILQEHVPPEHPVHIHAYHGSNWLLHKVLDTWPNSVFGVSGSVLGSGWTGDAAEIACKCPLSRLVLETDAPFLANGPKDVVQIAIKVAELKGISGEMVLSVTSSNCLRFYRIPDDIRLNASSPDAPMSACSGQKEPWHAAVDWEREARIASLKHSKR